MTRHETVTAPEPFSLQRRNPAGGTAPLGHWGFRNETDVLTDVLLGSPAFLRHLATSSLSRKHLREAPCNIQTAQAQEMVGDRAVLLQPAQKGGPGVGIDEALWLEWEHLRFRGLGRVAENEAKVGVGGDGSGTAGIEGSDVEPLVRGFEEPRERCRPFVHERPLQSTASSV